VIHEREIERLSARVQTLEQEKAAVDAFAAAAAHELLEPLILTESYAEMVSERLDDADHAESRRDLLALSSNARRVRLLVESLLLDARAARRPVERRPVDLNAVVQESLALLQFDGRRRAAHIEVEDLPQVEGEHALIASLYMNLLINALKFSPRDGPVIVVGSGAARDETVLFVESNAPSIPVEERRQIFEPFRRGRHERRAHGAGLGLAICRGIVERHGGRIWVRPAEEREGNRFCFTLGVAHPNGGTRSIPAPGVRPLTT
jgi:signal transduction histidine kinase